MDEYGFAESGLKFASGSDGGIGPLDICNPSTCAEGCKDESACKAGCKSGTCLTSSCQDGCSTGCKLVCNKG